MKVVRRYKATLYCGIDLFNRGEYFGAHEAWDGLWFRVKDKQVRRFVQGLIMTADALHLAKQRGRPSAATHLARSNPILRSGAETHPDLQLKDFIEALERLMRDQQWCSSGKVAYDLPMIKREKELIKRGKHKDDDVAVDRVACLFDDFS